MARRHGYFARDGNVFGVWARWDWGKSAFPRLLRCTLFRRYGTKQHNESMRQCYRDTWAASLEPCSRDKKAIWSWKVGGTKGWGIRILPCVPSCIDSIQTSCLSRGDLFRRKITSQKRRWGIQLQSEAENLPAVVSWTWSGRGNSESIRYDQYSSMQGWSCWCHYVFNWISISCKSQISSHTSQRQTNETNNAHVFWECRRRMLRNEPGTTRAAVESVERIMGSQRLGNKDLDCSRCSKAQGLRHSWKKAHFVRNQWIQSSLLLEMACHGGSRRRLDFWLWCFPIGANRWAWSWDGEKWHFQGVRQSCAKFDSCVIKWMGPCNSFDDGLAPEQTSWWHCYLWHVFAPRGLQVELEE